MKIEAIKTEDPKQGDQKVVKMVQKWSKMTKIWTKIGHFWVKMDPKWVQNGTQNRPKSWDLVHHLGLITIGIIFDHFWTQNGSKMAKMSKIWIIWVVQNLDHFGVQKGVRIWVHLGYKKWFFGAQKPSFLVLNLDGLYLTILA